MAMRHLLAAIVCTGDGITLIAKSHAVCGTWGNADDSRTGSTCQGLGGDDWCRLCLANHPSHPQDNHDHHQSTDSAHNQGHAGIKP